MSLRDLSQQTFAERVWFDTLGFCGCGQPDLVRDAMRWTLRCIDVWHNTPWNSWVDGFSAAYARFHALAAPTPEAALYLMFYVLDRAGLTEHGGSVPGWLEPSGEAFMASKEDDDE